MDHYHLMRITDQNQEMKLSHSFAKEEEEKPPSLV